MSWLGLMLGSLGCLIWRGCLMIRGLCCRLSRLVWRCRLVIRGLCCRLRCLMVGWLGGRLRCLIRSRCSLGTVVTPAL